MACYTRSLSVCLVSDRRPHLAKRGGNTLKVLDCGIGTGAFSTALISVWKGKLELHGIDASTKMLTKAKEHLAGYGQTPNLRLADGNETPFDDNQFDVVIAKPSALDEFEVETEHTTVSLNINE